MGSPAARRGSDGLVAIAILGFVSISVLRAVLVLGFPGAYDPARFQSVPDAVGDVLVTRAALEGRDPYAPLDELARAAGLPTDDLPGEPVHFRFPGALILQAPMAAIPPARAPSMVTIVNLAALGAVAWLVWRRLGVRWVAYALPVMAATPPFLELLAHGPAVGLLTIGVAALWWAERVGRPVTAGAMSGLSSVLRGFPLVLVAAQAATRDRIGAAWGAGIFVGLNAIGMAVLGLSFSEVLGASREATESFGPDVHNGSLAGMLMRLGVEPLPAATVGVVAVGSLWLLLTFRADDVDDAFAIGIPAMLLASPLSWPTYHLLLLPWAGVLVSRGAGRRVAAVAVLAIAAYGAWAVSGVESAGVGAFVISASALAVAARPIASSGSAERGTVAWPN